MINPELSIVGDLHQIASGPRVLQTVPGTNASSSAHGDGLMWGRLQTVPDASGKKEVTMKLSLRSTVLFLVLASLLSISAFAANDSHKGGMNISAPVQVAGKQLAAGDYTVKWDGSGPTVQVNLIRNGDVVATVPARVVKLDQKPDRDIVEVKTGSNGDRTLSSIQFEGKTYALEIGGEAAGGDSASGSNIK